MKTKFYKLCKKMNDAILTHLIRKKILIIIVFNYIHVSCMFTAIVFTNKRQTVCVYTFAQNSYMYSVFRHGSVRMNELTSNSCLSIDGNYMNVYIQFELKIWRERKKKLICPTFRIIWCSHKWNYYTLEWSRLQMWMHEKFIICIFIALK